MPSSHQLSSSSIMLLAVKSLVLAIALSSNLAESRFTAVDTFSSQVPESSSATTARAHARKGKGVGTTFTNGTNWAVLVAGSKGYGNYRHQADICHAYQILKRGGIKDENIVVFMYDDIANDPDNPRQGTIINHPRGSDVYRGVPKDYTGENVTASNLIAVLLGDKKKVKGGTRKVVNSGPNDNVFLYYADHGSPGILGMPAGGELYANDLVRALKKKHASKAYNRMVLYVEACESGSIFDGLLHPGMNIYVTTASNPKESSYATYCPDDDPSVPKEFGTCLGDLYSVSWMEDSDRHDPRNETLAAQYQTIRRRTISVKHMGSHVMQYGDSSLIAKDVVAHYIGSASLGPARHASSDAPPAPVAPTVDQREADILYLQQKVKRAPEGSEQKAEAQQELDDALAQRRHVDQSIAKIDQVLFGSKDGLRVMKWVRPQGQPLVDDWDCLKSLVRTYKEHCGSLETYGMKYMRAFANMCNAGIDQDRMARASFQACKP